MADLSPLSAQAKEALQQAVRFSFDQQRPDGHWVAEVSSDATFTSEYVTFKYAMGLDLTADSEAIKHWLLNEQKEDGSWGLAPELPGNVSTTTEAYLALKILGVSPEEAVMRKTRDFMLQNGGVARVRFFTRFFLATFGLFPWSAIPQLPAELILLPASSPLNIYTLSSWARSTLIPILVVAHHKPIYPLPNGLDSKNNFLDELWLKPEDKNVPFAPPLPTLFWEHEWIKLFFTGADTILAAADGLRGLPLRRLALKKCVDWLLEHQEPQGEWAGFFPPMHGSLWALLLEGYPIDHDVIKRGFSALERLAVHDQNGKRLTATVSPVWDTALMASSLCDAGMGSDVRVCKAAAWLKPRQLLGPEGDWRVYSPCSQAGGWSFEYHNKWYPDVDDTAVVVMALVKQDYHLVESDSVARAVTWILGMQNHDGGWAAFDCYNDKLWLHKIPFSDMDSLCDPSSADITGRILECFGYLLSHKRGRLDESLQKTVVASSARGIAYLRKEQQESGAWWGRWGNNYIYGTSNVLRGLEHFGKTDPEVLKMISAGVAWFESIQNTDGGWGETLASYDRPELAGRGQSTAAQTAWALQSLLIYRPASSQATQNGVSWLVKNQTVKSVNGTSWSADVYTGTGFPKVLYLGYPLYHHAFPVMALSKYLEVLKRPQPVTLPQPVVDALSQPSVSMMVTGSRGDVEPFLRIAHRLKKAYDIRVRIATHECHRKLIQDSGAEFNPTAGGPEVAEKAFTERPGVIRAYLGGHFAAIVSAYKTMLADCWFSIADFAPYVAGEKTQRRPFIADAVVSHRPILVHTHAAETLQVPLVLLSIQPDIPTGEFPHPTTMTKPKYQKGRWYNKLTYDLLEYVNLVAFGLFIDKLAVATFKLGSKHFVPPSLVRIPAATGSQVCMWSSAVVPAPKDWQGHATLAGYSLPPFDYTYQAPEPLLAFLAADGPVLAVSMGSMSMPDPVAFLRVLCDALAETGARAIISGSWTKHPSSTLYLENTNNIYTVDDIPHTWLLKRVRGFIHHGGAGHTAVGARSGVPMLMLPFFIDQHFWGARCRQLQLGPEPIQFSKTTATNLREAIIDLLAGEYDEACVRMASQLAGEGDGAVVAADIIARQVAKSDTARVCSLFAGVRAQWRHRGSGLLLSGLAAGSLVSQDLISWSDLDMHPAIIWGGSSNVTQASPLGILGILVQAAFRVLEFLLRVLAWGEQPLAARSTDPVREAKIRQSIYDLDFARNGAAIAVSEKQEWDDQKIAKNWISLIKLDNTG